MKLGRTIVDGNLEFVISREPDVWHRLAVLAPRASYTAEAIAALPEAVAALDRGDGAVVEPSLWASPVVRPSKILGIGLNYMDHIRETGADVPTLPIVFAKFPNAINNPTGDVELHPERTSGVDYEVELTVIVGLRVRDLTRENALSAVFGFCVANDVSARDVQRAEPQFSRSKSFDGFCPIGPWITTADEVADPHALRLRSRVNGEVRQDGSTADMIFDVRDLLVHLSAGMTLEPGDAILTGTPHGVGFAMEPPQFLAHGDVVQCEIEGLGGLENRFVSSR